MNPDELAKGGNPLSETVFFASLNQTSVAQRFATLSSGFCLNAILLGFIAFILTHIDTTQAPVLKKQWISLGEVPKELKPFVSAPLLERKLSPATTRSPPKKFVASPTPAILSPANIEALLLPDNSKHLVLPVGPTIAERAPKLRQILGSFAGDPTPSSTSKQAQSAAKLPIRALQDFDPLIQSPHRVNAPTQSAAFFDSASTKLTSRTQAKEPQQETKDVFSPTILQSSTVIRERETREGFGDSQSFGSSELASRKSAPLLTRLTASSFDSTVAVAPQPGKKSSVDANDSFKPIEILSKPKPLYTEEARQRRIEGEVHLRILFMADGKLKVLSILRGLGYGLDENAAMAASQIRFRAAMNRGIAVEQSAVVRVQFQLAD